MADYSRYGDPSPEWVYFTKNNALTTTGLAPGQSIEHLQQATNAAREKASAQYLLKSGIQENIACRDFQIPTADGYSIPARVYRPRRLPANALLPVYLFFHGGGFLFGTLDSEDANCQRIVMSLNIVVVNVCYRHSPQFKYPTQANDAWDAFQWVIGHFDTIGGDKDQLIIGGVSAGGALASSVVLKENKLSTGHGQIRGQILCIPQLFHPDAFPFHLFASRDICSYHQYVDAPVIPKAQLDLFKSILGADDPSDTSLFVGNCPEKNVIGMPKTAFLVAGMDPLRDESFLYAEKLRASGILTNVHVFKGLPHGFYRYASLPSTNRWFETIVESIKWTLSPDTISAWTE